MGVFVTYIYLYWPPLYGATVAPFNTHDGAIVAPFYTHNGATVAPSNVLPWQLLNRATLKNVQKIILTTGH
jgi:hypothetical protein